MVTVEPPINLVVLHAAIHWPTGKAVPGIRSASQVVISAAQIVVVLVSRRVTALRVAEESVTGAEAILAETGPVPVRGIWAAAAEGATVLAIAAWAATPVWGTEVLALAVPAAGAEAAHVQAVAAACPA